jgi:hypothetical protein|tara:strand:- start:129 stop:638 length:510 start_codon:yes stop_codon:yes gene_type:complete
MIVRLSKKDIHACELMGADTVKLCEMQGFPPRLENERQSRVEANIYGFKAEFAVAKVLGTDLPAVNVLTDGGVDLWFDDISIDVKFTNKYGGPLIFDNMEKFKADCAVLVSKTDDPASMRIWGAVGRKLFHAQAKTHDFGYGERLVMESRDLKPIEWLWRHLMERRHSQ